MVENPPGEDHIGTERDHLTSKAANTAGVAGGPARIDPQIAADAPAELLQPLHERTMAHRCFRIIGSERV